MNEAYPAGSFDLQTTETSNDENQRTGLKLVTSLINKLGTAKAMSVLSIAWTHGAMAILHSQSPLPETNIATLEGLADWMKGIVTDHTDCAKRLSTNAAPQDEEAADAPLPTPTVH